MEVAKKRPHEEIDKPAAAEEVDDNVSHVDDEPLIDAIDWKAFDATKWQDGEYGGGSKFGKFGTRLYGADKRHAIVRLPRMTVAFEPDAWTEVKEEAMRKKGKTVKNPLPSDRTTDKWTLQCYVDPAFEEWYRLNVEDPLCFDLAKQHVYTNCATAEKVSGKMSESRAVKYDEKTGRWLMSFSAKAPRGLAEAPFTLINAETRKEMPAGTKLGRGSEVNILCNFSESFCGAQLSAYAKPLAIYVRHLVRPANLDPKAYNVGEFDD